MSSTLLLLVVLLVSIILPAAHTQAAQSSGPPSAAQSSSTSVPRVLPRIISLAGTKLPSGLYDGSGASTLTIIGSSFTLTPTVSITGGLLPYSCARSPSNTDAVILCPALSIDAADVNRTLSVRVRTAAGDSNAVAVAFGSSGSDAAAEWRMLGMSMVTAITVVAVVGMVLIAAVCVCTLSLCCGVSFAFLRCCCRQREQQPTLLLSPQAYYTHTQHYQQPYSQQPYHAM